MLTETQLHQTMDGSVWAKDFMARFGHRKDEIDESLMLSWFCNAIMVGWDHAKRSMS